MHLQLHHILIPTNNSSSSSSDQELQVVTKIFTKSWIKITRLDRLNSETPQKVVIVAKFSKNISYLEHSLNIVYIYIYIYILNMYIYIRILINN